MQQINFSQRIKAISDVVWKTDVKKLNVDNISGVEMIFLKVK